MRKKKHTPVLVWQRGYRCHTLWHGKERLGRISLGKHGEWDGTYHCEAGMQRGATSSLAEAKRWVSEQVRKNLLQLALF
jgi:hypothetical protein